MTFDEWMLTKDKSYVPTDDSMSLRLLRECWFRRDAEIAGLNQRIDLLSEASLNITKERDQLREQVKMLRNELLWHKWHTYNPFEPDNQCNAHKRIC